MKKKDIVMNSFQLLSMVVCLVAFTVLVYRYLTRESNKVCDSCMRARRKEIQKNIDWAAIEVSKDDVDVDDDEDSDISDWE
jgi:hypothetical protein